MKIRSTACALLAAITLATSGSGASAQSGAWAGPYVGVNAGFATMDFDAFYTGPAVGTDLPFRQDISGFALGAFAGYNFRYDRVVFGPEVDISWLIGADSTASPGGKAALKSNVRGHVRGRAGYLVTDDILVYGALGMAISNVEVTRVPAALTPVDKSSDVMLGLSVGAGAEYAVTEDIHLRLDYVYDHYFRQSIAKTKPFGGVPFFPEIKTTAGSHSVVFGVSIDLY